MYSFTCWSVAGRPGTSDLLLEARVRSCPHTPRPEDRSKPARRFGRTTAGLRPPCVRPNRPTYVSLTGQDCCRAILSSIAALAGHVSAGADLRVPLHGAWASTLAMLSDKACFSKWATDVPRRNSSQGDEITGHRSSPLSPHIAALN